MGHAEMSIIVVGCIEIMWRVSANSARSKPHVPHPMAMATTAIRTIRTALRGCLALAGRSDCCADMASGAVGIWVCMVISEVVEQMTGEVSFGIPRKPVKQYKVQH